VPGHTPVSCCRASSAQRRSARGDIPRRQGGARYPHPHAHPPGAWTHLVQLQAQRLSPCQRNDAQPHWLLTPSFRPHLCFVPRSLPHPFRPSTVAAAASPPPVFAATRRIANAPGGRAVVTLHFYLGKNQKLTRDTTRPIYKVQSSVSQLAMGSQAPARKAQVGAMIVGRAATFSFAPVSTEDRSHDPAPRNTSTPAVCPIRGIHTRRYPQ
jgi:hypothetical protein